ncbi:MAG: hypothetical protein ABIQ74_12250 [Chitinophagales bacterium]
MDADKKIKVEKESYPPPGNLRIETGNKVALDSESIAGKLLTDFSSKILNLPLPFIIERSF